MREAKILQRIKSGDPSGLGALMDIYIPYVSVIVWNILRESMAPEDAYERLARSGSQKQSKK